MSWTSIGCVDIDTKPKHVLTTSSSPKQALKNFSYLANEKVVLQTMICYNLSQSKLLEKTKDFEKSKLFRYDIRLSCSLFGLLFHGLKKSSGISRVFLFLCGYLAIFFDTKSMDHVFSVVHGFQNITTMLHKSLDGLPMEESHEIVPQLHGNSDPFLAFPFASSSFSSSRLSENCSNFSVLPFLK